jgi:hypothetical protein
MSGFLDLLKKFSPLDDEQEAAPSRSPGVTSAQAQAAPSSSLQAPAQTVDAPIIEKTPEALLTPYVAPADAYVAPQIDIDKVNELVKKDNDGAKQLDTKLSDLKKEYDQSREDAARRQMYAEMTASLGNNIGTIVSGAQAMNTKANVQPVKTHEINVGDLVGNVDSHYFKNKEALLNQFKSLRDSSLGAKSYADLLKANAFLKQGEARINSNNENQGKQRGMQLGKEVMKDQEKNELSDKQAEAISGYDETLNAFGRIKDAKTGISTGKIADLRNMAAAKLGIDDPKVTALRTEILDTLATKIKALSGTAANESEVKRLQVTLPELGDSHAVFDQKLRDAERRVQEAKQIRLDHLKKYQGKNIAGYAQPKTEAAPQVSTDGTVKIMGPSGQVATLKAEAAEKYLQKPGYKRVD